MDGPNLPPPLPKNEKIAWILSLILVFLTGCLTSYLFLQARNFPPAASTQSVLPTPTPIASPTEGWNAYQNKLFGYSLKYPTDFTLLSSFTDSDTEIPVLPTTIFSIEKNNTFSSLVLTLRWNFFILYIPNLTSTQTCLVTPDGGLSLTKYITVNGAKFYYSEKNKTAAAGTHHTDQGYRIFISDKCFETDLKYSESSDWNNPADATSAAASEADAFTVFSRILSTFTFTK